MSDSYFTIERFRDGFIIADYSGDVDAGNGCAYYGKDLKPKAQPAQITGVFTTKDEAQEGIEILKEG